MRVLHFGRFDSPGFGGLERHVRLLLRGLANHVHVENLVAADEHAGPAYEERDGYRIYRAPSFGLLASMAVSPQLLLQARKLERTCHYDIVHLHFPDPLSHLAASLFPSTTRFVMTWHSDIVRQARLLKLYRPLLDQLLSRVDALIAATPAHFESSQQLSACPADRRFVVPYGLDYEVFRPTDRCRADASHIRSAHGNRRLVFALGRHVYYKGFEYLIRAMARIDAVLLLGGAGPVTRELQELANREGVADRVCFAGRIPEDQLPAYYHAADVFCMPSPERSEQFGLVQLEAMACRKPVVCCELANGVTYVNQHSITGLVVPPRDPDALAEAINRLLNDARLCERMGEAGYRRATSEFSLVRMVQGTLRVYEQVMGLAAGTLSRIPSVTT